ncbi:MAG TPA: regulatory protein RecX [Actinomycetota bacterium]|nr:regulatory protein RecX [Actinomycetota bacterium]
MATKRTVKQPLDCHERALRLLAVRPRARRELESRLRRAGFDTADVSSELDRLEDAGLLDDGAFARELADHLTVRGSARRAVAGALASKGVSRQTIEQTLAGLEGDESVRALEVATERARRLTSLRPEVAYGRLVSFLARRGYDGGVSREAARAALGIDDRRA